MPSKTRNFELLLTDQATKYGCDGFVYYNTTVPAGRYARSQFWELTPGYPPSTPSALRTRGYLDLQTKIRYAHVIGKTFPVGGPCFTWTKIFPVQHHPDSNVEADIASITDDLWTKLRIKVNGVKWNAAVDLAEAPKTFDMLINTAQRLTSAIRNLRKGRIDQVRKLFNLTSKDAKRDPQAGKDLANLWLEYKYGWSPLLKSCADAAEGLAYQMFVKPVFRFVRVRTVKGSYTKTFQDDILLESGGSGMEIRAKRTTVTEVECSAWCLLSKPATHPLGDFGFSDPHLVFWELVPFSFVVDWFIGIGNFLEASTAMLRCQVMDVGHSYMIHRKTDYEVYSVNPTQHVWTFTCTNRFLTYQGKEIPLIDDREYRRFADVDVPLPPPIVKNPLKIDRLLTTLALLKQKR